MQECWASRTSPSGLRCKEVRQKQCGYQEEGAAGERAQCGTVPGVSLQECGS